MAKQKIQDDDVQDQDELDAGEDLEPSEDNIEDDNAQTGSGNYHIGVIQVDLGEKGEEDDDSESEAVDVNEYEEIDETPAKASRKLLSSMADSDGDDGDNNAETFLGDVNFDPDEAWPLDD
ncbi:hypothetical protein KC640_01500 [Candidatus Dojkabacteria bacterium]|uniref:Uncharacterized protein n=1 Tax=Candidatus Dojkabacteria bacterium TaxID=2099670 RepID=A0A955I711_9BACT|nr:hypothetical protein [Candidatus Dojkabacteria bacterium]